VKDQNAVIIGAGIAGLSVAHALVKRGWQVSIIDRHGDIAKEATANPAPIVYPRLSVDNDVDTAFFTAAYHHTLYVLNSLQQYYRQRFWFGEGLLQLMEQQRADKILEKFRFNSDYMAVIDDLKDGQVRVEFPSAGVVLPAVLCDVLIQECGQKLNIITGEVTAIKQHGKQWQCLSGPEPITRASTLVIANGTGINKLGLPMSFPVEAIRGQVVELNSRPSSQHVKQTINAAVHITPEINGKHYLGASYIRHSDDLQVDPDENNQLLASLDEFCPDMFSEKDISNVWVGFRTMSKDRVPLVGAVADIEFFAQEYADICHGRVNKNYLPAHYLGGLYISAAHGSRGFTTSLLSAQIIAALIESEPPPVSKRVLDYLNPSRFIINDLKRG
jgi:tRNA 5-methylaminomethyl-2-thiouridine biosynthesis bifunctional protein